MLEILPVITVVAFVDVKFSAGSAAVDAAAAIISANAIALLLLL
jgi:hypothetical protein